MRQTYRSMLWAGLVAAGVAACGDDVTVTPPAPPPPPPAATVHSVSVSPDGSTVGIGANVVTMIASVNADAGVATTVTWSTSDATKATIAADGKVTTLAAGAVGIRACSTVNTSICGGATLNIVGVTATSVTVTPSSPTISVGGTVQLTASVAGTNNPAQTVNWTSLTPAVATVSATGLVTGVTTGNVAIQACSTVNATVCGAAAVLVVAPTVTSVTVTPPSFTLLRPATGNVQIQLVASVAGTNNPSQTVTWAQAAGTAGVLSVSATGLVTIASTSTTTGAPVVVTACSTVTGFTNVCGSSSITVQVPVAASASISTITWVPTTPGTCVPLVGQPEVSVLLSNVQCQIQINTNVNAGDQQLVRLDALIGGVVVGTQMFPGTSAANGGGSSLSAPVPVTISVNTQMVRRPVGSSTLFIPVIFNGNQLVTLNLYTSGSATPIASQATPIVMNNPDAELKNGSAFTLVNNSSSPSFTNISGTWFTGTQSGGSVNYVAFSTNVPTAQTFNSTGCGGISTSNTGQISGTATTGITIGANWSCAGFEGGNSITSVNFGGGLTVAATGPDGTATVKPAAFSNVGTAFNLNTAGSTVVCPSTGAPPAGCEQRWNMINPGTAPTASNSVLVDNKAPVITPNEIGFAAGCSGTIPNPGCWINGSYNLTGDFPATDGGTGVSAVNTFAYDPSSFPLFCTASSLTPSNAAEDASPTKYNACATAVDNIGNGSTAFGFNAFGVDKTSPTITYAKDPLVVNPLYSPNSTLAEAVPAQQLDWKVNDNNSGLETATALTIASSGTTLNGGCGIAINGTLDVAAIPGGDRFMLPANAPAPDAGCGLPGYYHYQATVTDRAGNTASDIDRVFGFEPGVPTINAMAPFPLYGGGTTTTVNVFASHTGASLSAAKVGIWYTSQAAGPVATPVQFVFNLGQIFNAPFQVPLFLATPSLGTPFSVSAGNSLAGVVIDSTLAPLTAFDSLTAIVRDVFDASNLTGALVHADTANMVNPPAFINPALVSTSGSVWSNPNMGAATFSGAGACTFSYATPTNGPTIPTAVWVVNQTTVGGSLVNDVLFTSVSAPTLISDNGTTRIYRYNVSASTCASLGGSLKLVAIKNDGSGLPVGYIVQ